MHLPVVGVMNGVAVIGTLETVIVGPGVNVRPASVVVPIKSNNSKLITTNLQINKSRFIRFLNFDWSELHYFTYQRMKVFHKIHRIQGILS